MQLDTLQGSAGLVRSLSQAPHGLASDRTLNLRLTAEPDLAACHMHHALYPCQLSGVTPGYSLQWSAM